MGKGFVIALACFAATGSFLFGYDSGVMTNVIASPNFLEYFDTDPESNIIGAINSTFSGGAAIGAFSSGVIVDSWGRKRSIQVGAVVAFIGAALQTGATKLVMMLVGRIIAGWAIGLLSPVIPVYQSECAHPSTRGFIVGLAQQMIGIGFIVSSWVGYGCGYASSNNSFQWRFPLALQCLPAIMLAIGMTWFPESPRHLVKIEKYEEARNVLYKLHHDGTNEAWIEEDFANIKQTIEAEKSVTVPGWTAMFVVPQWAKRLFIGTINQVFGQMTGCNVINYYQTVMYRALGFTGHRVTLMACLFSLVGPTTNIFFILYLIDRVGRRKPLLYGIVAVSLALACEGIVNSQNPDGDKKVLSGLGIAFLWIFSCVFSLSFGPTCWAYTTELMPMQVRGKAVAFAIGLGQWGVATCLAQVSPKALGKIGWKYYFVFVAFNMVISLPCIYFFFVETKQKSLEEIDELFGGQVDVSKYIKDNKQAVSQVETKEV